MVSPSICQRVVDDHLSHLRQEFQTTPTDKGCFVTTPFLRPDGESIELVVEFEDGHLRLSDMGDSIGYLYVNGLTLSRQLMQEAKGICQQFGIRLVGSELSTSHEQTEALGAALHNLTQAVLAVTSLLQRRRTQVRVQFDGEVESFIIASGATYDEKFEVQGRQKTHNVRFYVDSGRNLLIQPLTATLERVAFSWAERWAYRFGDIREAEPAWTCLAVLDDRGDRSQVWSTEALAPLQDYLVRWSDRERFSEALAPG